MHYRVPLTKECHWGFTGGRMPIANTQTHFPLEAFILCTIYSDKPRAGDWSTGALEHWSTGALENGALEHWSTGDWRLETGDWRLETGDWRQTDS